MLRLLQGRAGIALLLAFSAGCGQHTLRHDAEAAEDVAIRYADASNGVHSGHFAGMAEYERTRDRRIAEMFQKIGGRHGVSEAQLRESLAHRPLGVDIAVMLSFAALYVGIADVIAGRVGSVVMTAYVSIVLGALAAFLGEAWAILVEQLRLGSGHLSYRADRIPWGHHRLSLLVAGIALYWLVAMIRARRSAMFAARLA